MVGAGTVEDVGGYARGAMGAMANLEIELKLHVPADRVAGVEAALGDPIRVTRIHLQAAYYDTPDRRLAAAGMAWRVRREGRRWVQTLKASTPESDGMEREEHNVVVRCRGWPVADPSLHAGTPAGDRLAELLATCPEPPVERFRTDVWRRERRLRVKGGHVVLAFDTGTITAGDARTDVCELEVELVSGAPQAVIDTASKWVTRHRLWLDTINKAQRGALVADGVTSAPVARGATPVLTASMGLDAAVREMVRACLVQVLRNTSAIANGLGDPEHVHMARVGIRKMRTVLSEFGPLSPAVDPTWSASLGEVFARLGVSRDRDVLEAMAPTLAAAGAPVITPPQDGDSAVDDPETVTRDPAFSLLALDLLGYVHGMPAPTEHDGRLVELAAEQLELLRRRSLRRPKRFATLPEPAQHSVRKRLKRLRYTAELTASLFPARKVKRYVKTLAPAQETLGALNDLCVARDTFRSLAEHEPAAWFAVGWLVARQEQAIANCVSPLRDAARARPYWAEVGTAAACR